MQRAENVRYDESLFRSLDESRVGYVRVSSNAVERDGALDGTADALVRHKEHT